MEYFREMKSNEDAIKNKWDKVLGSLVFGDSAHIMSKSVLSQTSDTYTLEKFMLGRQHTDVLYSSAIKLFPDTDVYLAHENSISAGEAATCSEFVVSTTSSITSKVVTRSNSLLSHSSSPQYINPSTISLVPGLLGGLASACSFKYAAELPPE